MLDTADTAAGASGYWTEERIMIRDMAISAAALIVAAALFWGSGIRFSLIFFDTNWLIFSILTLFLMETPLFFWFARKYGIDFSDFD